MKHLLNFVNAVLGGIMIGIGGAVFLACENKVVGSILFAVGLFTICIYKMDLFTGKIGYILSEKPSYLITCLITWIGNLAGTFAVGMALAYLRNDLSKKAADLVSKKAVQMPLQSIILGVLCGILMFIAVDNFKNNKDVLPKYIGIFVCVSVFILAGFEHSVADMFYFAAAQGTPIFYLDGILFIIYVSIGNILGAVMIPVGKKILSKK